MSHRPQDSKLVRNLCLQREQLRKMHACDFGRNRAQRPAIFASGIRLGIVRIDVRTTTGLPDHDHGGLFRVALRWTFRSQS